MRETNQNRPNTPMTITRHHFSVAQTKRGGFRREQFELLGIKFPPTAGWKEQVIGAEYPDEIVKQFVAMGDGGKSKRLNGQSGEGLPIGHGVRSKTANIVASFNGYLQNLGLEELNAVLPAVSWVYRKAKQRLDDSVVTR